MLDALPTVKRRVELWRLMFEKTTAADILYRGILARVHTTPEMRELHDALGLKRIDPELLRVTLAKEKTPARQGRRSSSRLVRAWPDDLELGLRVLDAFEDAGDTAGERTLARKLRRRDDTNAKVRTAVGEAYLRLAKLPGGSERDEAEARRAFGEIVEFAVDDPVARRRLGDLLRSHGWYDEAFRQYETLAKLTPDDASVALLLSSAAAGMGKVEEAVGWTEKGALGAPDGRSAEGPLAHDLASVILASAEDDAVPRWPEGRGDGVARAGPATARRERRRAGRNARAFLTWSHPEVHTTLFWGTGATLRPAPEGDPLLGLAAVSFPAKRHDVFVEVRLEPEDAEVAARLDAEATAHRDLWRRDRGRARPSRPDSSPARTHDQALSHGLRSCRRGGGQVIAALKRGVVLLIGAAAIVVFTMAFRVKRTSEARVVYVTLGEVQAIHAEVRVGGSDVLGVRRYGRGDRITTDKDGRGRARLDYGTRASSSTDRRRSSRSITAASRSKRGASSWEGAPGARSEVTVGDITVLVGTSAVAFDRTDTTGFYCASGEVVARAFGKEVRVHSGERARTTGKELTVAPEKVWNDWTHGMAHPWSAAGKPRGAVGELWGRLSDVPDDAGSPLATRSHRLEVSIQGELARTETRTTYFNAGSKPVIGDFRMALPEGAIVSGFAVGVGESLEVGSVRLGRDAPGPDPRARLEWAGEGWVRGTTGTIRPAETVVVYVRYTEWLSPAGDRMTYRYPMVGEGVPPVIGEFHAVIDAEVDATAVGIGPDMQMQGNLIETQRADFRPTSGPRGRFQLRPGRVRSRARLLRPRVPGIGRLVLARPDRDGARCRSARDDARAPPRHVTQHRRDLARRRARRRGGAASTASARTIASSFSRETIARRRSAPPSLARSTTRDAPPFEAAWTRSDPEGRRTSARRSNGLRMRLPASDPSAMLLYLGDGWPTLGDAGTSTCDSRPPRPKARRSAEARSGRRWSRAEPLRAVRARPLGRPACST